MQPRLLYYIDEEMYSSLRRKSLIEFAIALM